MLNNSKWLVLYFNQTDVVLDQNEAIQIFSNLENFKEHFKMLILLIFVLLASLKNQKACLRLNKM